MATQELGTNTVSLYPGSVITASESYGQLGATAPSVGQATPTTNTSISTSQTVATSGATVVAFVTGYYNPSTGYASFSRSVTCGGVAMTLLASTDNNNTAGSGWCEMYILTGVSAGTPTVTYSVFPGASLELLTDVYDNVDSWDAPVVTFGSGTAESSGAVSSGTNNVVVTGFSSPLSKTATCSIVDVWGPVATTGYCGALLANTPWTSSVTATATAGASGAWATISVNLKPPVTGVTGASVPANVVGCWVTLIGCGGAGSGGGYGNAVDTSGSGGGGGSAVFNRYVPASALGTTYSVTVPYSPVGGKGASSGTNGTSGGTGAGNVVFTSGTTTLQVESSTSATNTSNSTTPGFPALGIGDFLGNVGGNGSATSLPTAGGPGGGPTLAGSGGGGGGRSPAGSAAGGNSLSFNLTGGAGGSSGSPNGQPGPAPRAFVIGAGGGGGWGGDTNGIINGGKGGDGTGYGAGGGGGGNGGALTIACTGTNASNGGNGGAGGPGFCGIVWDYK